jgi:hypothetical protein
MIILREAALTLWAGIVCATVYAGLWTICVAVAL